MDLNFSAPGANHLHQVEMKATPSADLYTPSLRGAECSTKIFVDVYGVQE